MQNKNQITSSPIKQFENLTYYLKIYIFEFLEQYEFVKLLLTINNKNFLLLIKKFNLNDLIVHCKELKLKVCHYSQKYDYLPKYLPMCPGDVCYMERSPNVAKCLINVRQFYCNQCYLKYFAILKNENIEDCTPDLKEGSSQVKKELEKVEMLLKKYSSFLKNIEFDFGIIFNKFETTFKKLIAKVNNGREKFENIKTKILDEERVKAADYIIYLKSLFILGYYSINTLADLYEPESPAFVERIITMIRNEMLEGEFY
jgi:hypothetical protein